MIQCVDESLMPFVTESYAVKLKAEYLLAHNIKSLLKRRGQTPHDLAWSCRKSDAWLSKILNAEHAIDPKDKRGMRIVDLDKIADFFGLATYQLFSPGISPLTERRSGRDRRTGLDRRISHAQEGLRPPRTPDMETVTPGERAHLERMRRLSDDDRKLVETQIDRLLLNPPDGASGLARTPDHGGASPEPIETPPRSRRQRKA